MHKCTVHTGKVHIYGCTVTDHSWNARKQKKKKKGGICCVTVVWVPRGKCKRASARKRPAQTPSKPKSSVATTVVDRRIKHSFHYCKSVPSFIINGRSYKEVLCFFFHGVFAIVPWHSVLFILFFFFFSQVRSCYRGQ